MMWGTYFKNVDYLISQGEIRATLIYPTKIEIGGPNIHLYSKFFPGLAGYDLVGNTVIPCQIIAAVLGVLRFISTTFSVP